MRRRLQRWLVRSFGHPTGLGGLLAAWVMARRPSNVARSRWAVDLLDLGPDDHLLEVGCGPGVALHAARARTPHVVGVDRSAIMVRAARRRSGATVVQAPVEALPPFDRPFTHALAVNTVGHWDDPVAGLVRVREALTAGGTIAVVSQPRLPGATAEHSRAAAAETVQRLLAAGFVDPRVETLVDLDPPAVCVLACHPRSNVRISMG